jgi:hypothetical protein
LAKSPAQQFPFSSLLPKNVYGYNKTDMVEEFTTSKQAVENQ